MAFTVWDINWCVGAAGPSRDGVGPRGPTPSLKGSPSGSLPQPRLVFERDSVQGGFRDPQHASELPIFLWYL